MATALAMILCFVSGASLVSGLVAHAMSISSPKSHYVNSAAALAMAITFAVIGWP